VLGGKYPLVASAQMSVVTAKVAGVPRGPIAGQAWRVCGQVIVCDSYKEVVQVTDEIASEPVRTTMEERNVRDIHC
jgi:histidinol dehydrogenase